MLSFSDLYNRLKLVLEVRPEKGQTFNDRLPGFFKGVPQQMTIEGLTAGQYQTVVYIAKMLHDLDIMSKEEHAYITSSSKAYGKTSAGEKANRLVEFLNNNTDKIEANAEKIKEKLSKGLEVFLRGHDMYGDRIDPRFGNIGATKTKRLDNKAKEAEKQKAREMKKGAKKLAADADSPVVADVINQVSQAADDYINVTNTNASYVEMNVLVYAAKLIQDLMNKVNQTKYQDPGLKENDLDLLDIVSHYLDDNVSTLKEFVLYIKELSKQASFIDEKGIRMVMTKNRKGELVTVRVGFLTPNYIAKQLFDIYMEIKPKVKEIVAKDTEIPKNPAAEENEDAVPPVEAQLESTTYHYLSEQIKKDKLTHRSTEVSVSFKEKYKPKTHWQLAELRRYGM